MVFLFILAAKVLARCARVRYQRHPLDRVDSLRGGGSRMSPWRQPLELADSSEAFVESRAQSPDGHRGGRDALCNACPACVRAVVRRAVQYRVSWAPVVV